jgi:hypothetical protein
LETGDVTTTPQRQHFLWHDSEYTSDNKLWCYAIQLPEIRSPKYYALIFAIVLLTVGYESVKRAVKNPVSALRTE